MSKFFDETMQGLLEAAYIEYRKTPERKKPVVKRVYESSDWIIDLIDNEIRISLFKDNHFVDEVFINKDNFEKLHLWMI